MNNKTLQAYKQDMNANLIQDGQPFQTLTPFFHIIEQHVFI